MTTKTLRFSPRRGRPAALALLAFLFPAVSAHAAKTADETCEALARKAQRTLWSSVRETGDSLFCRKSWVPGKPDELSACGVWTKANVFSNKTKNAWNRLFDKAGADWATWGPRGISAEWEEGTIRGGFKRTFFGAGLAYSKTTVEVVKEGGRAEGTVTVCALDYDGKVRAQRQKGFESGKGGEGRRVTIALEHQDNRILGVVVDTPPSVNSFEYRARVLSEPIRNDLPPVKGVADLHVHQMMNVAMGGRFYWGHHSGFAERALAREEVNPAGTGLDLTSLAGLAKQLVRPERGLDANVLFWATGLDPKTGKPKKTDEGFFRYGGEGHPSYRDWPHHADRSHQQVHLPWLKEAHERQKETGSNLALVVVSLVNNDVLCSVAKTFDPFGNVPHRGGGGQITGWESAPWGCSDHENALRQLRAMHEIEKQNPWYRIAMSPWHARQIVTDGDLAVVVSMETDKPLSGEGNNYGNWEHQLDAYRAMGLSTMQIVHESDSKFCGAAVHRTMMEALQSIHWPLKTVASLLQEGTTRRLDQNGYNELGLTKEGEKLVDALVERSMPIDLAHGSQRCRQGIMARVGTGYGLYDSHTKFRRLLRPERGQKSYGTHVLDREKELLIAESFLPEYKKHGVLIGLRTASVDVYDAPNSKVPNTCPGSARSFAQMVQYAHDSGLTFAYGTDFNTGVSQLGPRFGSQDSRCWAALPDLANATKRPVQPEGDLPARARLIKPIAGTDYYTDGLATIGWLPELTEDLVALGTPGASRLRDSAEAYLDMWERAYPPEGAGPRVPDRPGVKPGSVALGGSCTAGDQCRSGRCTGVAGARGVCVCNEDGDCGGGRYCDAGPDLKQNKCLSKKADNVACAVVGGGHQCQSGHCKLGRCYTPDSVAMGGACYVDDACAKGKCSSIDGTKGTCVCKADSDCGNGFWCDGGMDLKRNACKAKLAKGEVCGKVGEMGVGHRCKSGKCKVAGFSTNLKCQ